MTRLIGGLLVVSLLYGPAKFQVKYYSYSYSEDISKADYAFKKENGNRKENGSLKRNDTSNGRGSKTENVKENGLENSVGSDVDFDYTELDGSPNLITDLIMEKNMIYKRIESELDLRSHLKLTLNSEQIESFSDFMNCYYAEDKIIKENLNKIEPNTVSVADLHNSANFDLVLEEFNIVNEYKCNVINSILRVIDSGNKTLQALQEAV